MLALEEAPTARFLKGLADQMPGPDAIIVASAHWETDEPMITGAMHPETMHDFHGFPEELYELEYSAMGNPLLASQVKSIMNEAGFKAAIDPERGLDHGVWNPLLLLYPQADIPVIELSVQSSQDALWHYRMGETLAPLRQKNILIIGTGNLTHNLREAFRGQHSQPPSWVKAFARWVSEKVAAGNITDLLDWKTLAPYALENHPTPEHFLPFFVALGAAGMPLQSRHLHEDIALGVLAMDAYSFGE